MESWSRNKSKYNINSLNYTGNGNVGRMISNNENIISNQVTTTINMSRNGRRIKPAKRWGHGENITTKSRMIVPRKRRQRSTLRHTPSDVPDYILSEKEYFSMINIMDELVKGGIKYEKSVLSPTKVQFMHDIKNIAMSFDPLYANFIRISKYNPITENSEWREEYLEVEGDYQNDVCSETIEDNINDAYIDEKDTLSCHEDTIQEKLQYFFPEIFESDTINK